MFQLLTVSFSTGGYVTQSPAANLTTPYPVPAFYVPYNRVHHDPVNVWPNMNVSANGSTSVNFPMNVSTSMNTWFNMNAPENIFMKELPVMDSTMVHDFGEYSAAKNCMIKTETHEDTDLMPVDQENSITTIHLSPVAGNEESSYSSNAKCKSESLQAADIMPIHGDAVIPFTPTDDLKETKFNKIKCEMFEDSEEMSTDQENEVNTVQPSPESTNILLHKQQEYVKPTSNKKLSNAQPEESEESSQHMSTLHEATRFICEVCDKYFTSASGLTAGYTLVRNLMNVTFVENHFLGNPT